MVWNVSAGDHVIIARAIEVMSTPLGGKPRPVYLDESQTNPNAFFVPKVSVPSADTAEVMPILNKVDSLENAFGALIPAAIKEATATLLSRIELFRSNITLSYVTKKFKALNERDRLTALSESIYEAGSTPATSLRYVDIPKATIALFGATLVTFVFGSSMLFYGVCILLIIWLIDVVVRSIKKIFVRLFRRGPTHAIHS